MTDATQTLLEAGVRVLVGSEIGTVEKTMNGYVRVVFQRPCRCCRQQTEIYEWVLENRVRLWDV